MEPAALFCTALGAIIAAIGLVTAIGCARLDGVIAALATTCGACIVAFAIGFTETDKNYRQGQIDALTGKVQYHLVVHPDKTATWEEIKEGE